MRHPNAYSLYVLFLYFRIKSGFFPVEHCCCCCSLVHSLLSFLAFCLYAFLFLFLLFVVVVVLCFFQSSLLLTLVYIFFSFLYLYLRFFFRLSVDVFTAHRELISPFLYFSYDHSTIYRPLHGALRVSFCVFIAKKKRNDEKNKQMKRKEQNYITAYICMDLDGQRW